MDNLYKAIRLHGIDLANAIFSQYGQKEYRRFIILGRSRVGSNMLRSLLNTHNNLYCFGELFRHRGEVGWDTRYYRHRLLDLFSEGKFLQDRPIDFLSQKIFKRYPAAIQAVGFKIFYYHALDPEWKDVWTYLKENNIHIIHLKRRNLLQVLLSKKLAETSGNWTGKSYGDVKLHLDPATCSEEFQKTEQWWEEFDEFFRYNNSLEVWYEDLAVDVKSETGRIFDFLGVQADERTIQPSTRKQRKTPPDERIENFEELKNYFQGTKWESFF